MLDGCDDLWNSLEIFFGEECRDWILIDFYYGFVICEWEKIVFDVVVNVDDYCFCWKVSGFVVGDGFGRGLFIF